MRVKERNNSKDVIDYGPISNVRMTNFSQSEKK